MADYRVTQYIYYFEGARDARYPGNEILSNQNSRNYFDTFDILYTLSNGFYSEIGYFIGTADVDGSTFIVFSIFNSSVRLNALANAGSSDLQDFPVSFRDLPIKFDPFIVCFLAGTMIATPTGERPIEALAIGDLVLTADGRTAPVKWLGIQTVATLFADPLRALPIRISAGALKQALPVRDLLVSPDHALMLDGVLVQAGALVNGNTIVREAAMPERYTYYHLELEGHALILAEGVPAETFLDTVTRRRFDNFAEYEALYGDIGATIAEMETPRIKSARQLPRALRARLDERAAATLDALATVA